MQRRGTNVVVGADRAQLGAKELNMASVLQRNKKQITAVLASLTVLAVLLSKLSQYSTLSIAALQWCLTAAVWQGPQKS